MLMTLLVVIGKKGPDSDQEQLLQYCRNKKAKAEQLQATMQAKKTMLQNMVGTQNNLSSTHQLALNTKAQLVSDLQSMVGSQSTLASVNEVLVTTNA